MRRISACLVALAMISVLPAAAQEGRTCKPDDVSRRLRLNTTTFTRQEPIRMRLVVKNTSGKTCTMGFPSGRGGTVRVFQAGQAVWEHHLCRVFTQHFEYQTWEAGHREVYRFKWRQRMNAQDDSGRLSCDGERQRARPGRYEVEGEFFGTDPNAQTERDSFRIIR